MSDNELCGMDRKKKSNLLAPYLPGRDSSGMADDPNYGSIAVGSAAAFEQDDTSEDISSEFDAERNRRNPGQVWQTKRGNFGAKNRDGNTSYFDNREDASEYSKNTVPGDYEWGSEPEFKSWLDKQYQEKEPEPEFDPDDPMSYAEHPDHEYENKMTVKEVAFQLGRLREALKRLKEKSPAGWENTVKAMKKHKTIDNPWALANWMKSKGAKSHKEISENLNERNYRKEYDNYQGTAEQKKRRAQRNRDRRKFERDGKVKKGDGMDVHHKDGNPFNHSSKNTSVLGKSKNRSIKERAISVTEEKIRLLVRKKLGEIFNFHVEEVGKRDKGTFNSSSGDDFFKSIKKGAQQSTKKGVSPKDALSIFNKKHGVGSSKKTK
jgi:hypothetical protein